MLSLRLAAAVLVLFIGGSASLAAQAPGDLPVDARFTATPLAEALRRLDRQLPLQLVFSPADLPDKSITASYVGEPFDDVLKDLLRGTAFSFFYYRDYAVVIGRHDLIESTFTAEYYRTLENARTAEATPARSDEPAVGSLRTLEPSGQARIRGVVRDAATGDPVAGATVYWPATEQGANTDDQGRFSLSLPAGRQPVQVQYIGYATLDRTINVLGSGELELELVEGATNLQEVLVSAAGGAEANVSDVRIGVTRLDIRSLEKLPSLLGEIDIVRAILLDPGVATIGEGAAGFNVRGGEVDQNLILQDGAVLFNATHALGFFSSFNPDIVGNVQLYKGNLPAQYGGRLASVLDVELRDGSFDRWKLRGGIGVVSGRLAVEGPVIPKTSSLLAGFRGSYSDWILRRVKILEVQRSSAFFYDANLRYTHKFNPNNTLVLSAYVAEDEFSYNDEFGFDYRTAGVQGIYRKVFHERLFARLTAGVSRYTSRQVDLAGADASRLDNELTYLRLQPQVTFLPHRTLQIDAGLSAIYYLVDPGRRVPDGPISQVVPAQLPRERGLESAVFTQAEWTVSPALAVSGGVRFNAYQFLGPRTERTYAGGVVDPERIIDSTYYGSGEVVAAYTSLEPRLSARYRLSAAASVKAGYSRTAQFINQIFNSDTPTPTSQYQLSTPYIPPFRAHNFSAGYFRNLMNNRFETSVEVYYRIIDQLWDYRDFARLTVNEQLETEILTGHGRAYGLELSLKSHARRINGQAGYTLSRTERRVPGINRGEWYVSNFDKPHNLTLLFNYQPNQRHTLSANFTYSTGRPTTAPLTNYRVGNGLIIPVYSDRNQLRIPDYHRLDLSYTLGRGYNRNKTWRTSWTFSLYNVYARRNAFSVFYTQDPYQNNVANRLSVLGTVFPAITINFETI